MKDEKELYKESFCVKVELDLLKWIGSEDITMKSKFYRVSLFFIVILGIFFLVACTPPSYRYMTVDKVVVVENIFYARTTLTCDYCDNAGELFYYSSPTTYGRWWKEIDEPSAEILQLLDRDDHAEQSVLCLPDDLLECYRLTGTDRIEISMDGGNVWQVDWQIPLGRKEFMDKYVYGYEPDITPHGLDFIKAENKYYVVTAMGNQGVLVKLPSGEWYRTFVGDARPTPFKASSFDEATGILYDEQINSLLLSVLFFLLSSFCTWITMYFRSDRQNRKKVLQALLPFSFPLLIFVLYYILTIAPPLRFVVTMIDINISFIYLSFLGFFVTWLAILIVSVRKRFGLLALTTALFMPIALFFSIFSPLQLWALGVVSFLRISQVIAGILGVVVLVVGIYLNVRFSTAAVRKQ